MVTASAEFNNIESIFNKHFQGPRQKLKCFIWRYEKTNSEIFFIKVSEAEFA